MRVFDPHPFFEKILKGGKRHTMSKTIEKLKSSRYYGLVLLAAMLLFFYGFY